MTFSKKPNRRQDDLYLLHDDGRYFFLLPVKPFKPNRSHKRSGGAMHTTQSEFDKRCFQRADADFWRSKSGELLVVLKIKYYGNSAKYYRRAVTRDGEPVSGDQLADFTDYVFEKQLCEWLLSPDDPPNCVDEDEGLFRQIRRLSGPIPMSSDSGIG